MTVRAMFEIMRAHRWGTNAKMIDEAVRPLGYIEGHVIDLTYGEHGGFWKQWRPEHLTTNDLNASQAELHHDFTALPFLDRVWETVVYDPPYKLNGRSQEGDIMDQRFGTGRSDYMLLADKLAMIGDGAREAWRVTNKWLLVKCQDQVVSGAVYWMTQRITTTLENNGARLKDRFDLLVSPRPQPSRRSQQHARSNYSTLLVFIRE